MDAFTVNPQVDEAFEADMGMGYDPESDYEGGGDTGESWDSWDNDQDLQKPFAPGDIWIDCDGRQLLCVNVHQTQIILTEPTHCCYKQITFIYTPLIPKGRKRILPLPAPYLPPVPDATTIKTNDAATINSII